jgi:pimeloyl-ACP methyl ester carboxylesterase
MLFKWLHRVTMPVQLVWGQDDEIMPLPYAHALQKLMPHSALSVFPNCGHLPQVEKSEEFVQLVTQFIKKVAQS